ncbi:MAG: transposase, partial [bacterium]|nr:transposase [bacterium]
MLFGIEAEDFGLQLPTATPVRKESFCAARHKLLPKTMKKLLRKLTGSALDPKPGGTWKGRPVFAVDGCKVNLQPREELIDAFGLPKKAHCPQILVSAMLDVVSGVPVDVELSGYRGNERGHLIAMLAGVAPGSLVILDRGYPSYEVIRMLTDAGIDFLIRVCEDSSFKATRSLKEDRVIVKCCGWRIWDGHAATLMPSLNWTPWITSPRNSCPSSFRHLRSAA